MARKRKICIKVWLNEQTFPVYAEMAEKTGFRRGGLQLYTQKPHGFQNETVANTDGISKYLKFCHKYYVESEARRLAEAAEIARIEKEIQEKKKLLGIK